MVRYSPGLLRLVDGFPIQMPRCPLLILLSISSDLLPATAAEIFRC